MIVKKIVNIKTVVLAASMMAPAAFAAGEIDVSAGVAYVAGALVAVAALGGAYLGLDNLKKVWSKITATRV
ncbi:hypothetical protein [Vibrio cholerae]|uniref:hypothetical protein n=1 Tax=Vibrio cholerae TaxID=666 RepID=UPI000E0BFF4A|nr:hypothetical protein [Vibrio cholerae]